MNEVSPVAMVEQFVLKIKKTNKCGALCRGKTHEKA